MSDKKRIATIYDYARFLKEGCDEATLCYDCPLNTSNNGKGLSCSVLLRTQTDEYNDIILKWIDEHPQKTRQSELLKLFPEIKMDNGVIDLCPNSIKKGFANGKLCAITGCDECQKKFWLEEIE